MPAAFIAGAKRFVDTRRKCRPSPTRRSSGCGVHAPGSACELSAAQRRQLRIDAGLLVRQATGAARSEGIRAGDLIVAINDVRLERVEDFIHTLSSMLPGRTVAMPVMRDRRLAYVPVRIPERRGSPSS